MFSRVRLFVTPRNSPWNSPGLQNPGVASSPPGDLPNPGVKPRSPARRANSLPAEPPGKPKNTGAGSLSLLQGIFPTQESNRGLVHCRQILYPLSYERTLRWSSDFSHYPLNVPCKAADFGGKRLAQALGREKVLARCPSRFGPAVPPRRRPLAATGPRCADSLLKY